MRRAAILLAGALWAQQAPDSAPASSPSLADRAAAIVAASPAVARAAWGARFIDLATGDVLWEKDADHHFVPASNMKLYSTALAMARLGPDHRFTTRVMASAPPDAAGVVAGDLIVAGGGDPSLSGRPYPFREKAKFGDPLEALDTLAAQVQAAGVRRVRGQITGDDRAWYWEPYPPGWSIDDASYDYGAAVSALSVADNTTVVRVRAGDRPGDAARVSVTPELGLFQVQSHVVTGARGSGQAVSRNRTASGFVLRGSVPAGGAAAMEVAVGDPALFAAHAFRELLIRRGITVDGDAAARHRHAHEGATPDATAGVEIASRVSPPLSELAAWVNKDSHNLHAEMLLRAVGQAKRGVGSRRAGLEELRLLLRGAGVATGDVSAYDASGLSRLSLTTPAATVQLLRYMRTIPAGDAWAASLALGGEDGTLEKRFRNLAGARVAAKTGTLTHITALSGYVWSRSGRALAFSVMVNNTAGAASGARAFIDSLIMLFVEEEA